MIENNDQILVWVAQNGLNLFLQSTALILIGLFAAWLLRKKGSAVQSTVYRATLIAVVLCPLAGLLLDQSGFQGWTLKLPVTTRIVQVELATEMGEERSGDSSEESKPGLATPRLDQANILAPDNRAGAATSANTQTAGEELPLYVQPIPQNGMSEFGSATIAPLANRPNTIDQKISNVFWVNAYRIVVAIWLVGALILLTRLMIAYRKLARIRKRSLTATAATRSICCGLADQLDVNAPDVLRNSLLSSPCLAGIVSPAILLPAEIEGQVPLEKAFAHELAHLRRRDTFWNLIQRISLAIFFFQPLLWRLVYRLETTAEEVCDDFVVTHCQDRTGYAQQLVALAESNLLAPSVAGLGMFNSKTMLGHRVVRILDTTRSLTTRVSLPMVAGIFAMAMSAAALSGLISDQSPAAVVAIETEQDPDSDKDGSNSLTQITGRILDQSGNAIPGAEIKALPTVAHVYPGTVDGPYAATQSNSDGSFNLEIDESKMLLSGHTHIETRDNLALVVTKPGYSISWASMNKLDSGASAIQRDKSGKGFLPVDIKMPKSKIPLELTIIDTEGTPVADARVKIKRIQTFKNDDLKPIFESAAKKEIFRQAFLPRLDDSLIFHGLKESTSDKNGKVVIPDLGDDRQIDIEVNGKGIASTTSTHFTNDHEAVSFEYGGMMSTAFTFHGCKAAITTDASQLIRGKVVDIDSGNPIANVKVYSSSFAGESIAGVNRLGTTTAADGSFELDGMPRGSGNSIIAVPSDQTPYFMKHADVPLASGFDPVEMTLKLKRGVWIEGKATDKQTGEPIAGARLYYLPFLDNEFAMKSGAFGPGQFMEIQTRYGTKADGTYKLVGLPGGAIVGIQALSGEFMSGTGWDTLADEDKDHNGHGRTFHQPVTPSPKWPTAVRKVDIEEGTTEIAVDFELEKGRGYPLKIVGPDGAPLISVTASRLRSGQDFFFQTQDSLVTASFKSDEKRLIRFESKELKIARVIEIGPSDFANRTGPLEVKLLPYATIQGRVVNADGDPLNGTTINATIGSGDYSMRLIEVGSDEEGRFKHDEIPVGATYYLSGQTGQMMFTVAKDLKVDQPEMIDVGEIDGSRRFKDPLHKPKRSPLEEKADEKTEKKTEEEEKTKVRVAGKVVDLTERKPVAGVKIMLGEDLLTTSNKDGTFEFKVHPKYGSPNALFRLLKEGFADSTGQVFGDRESVEFVIANAAHSVAGKVVDTEGNPVVGAEVSLIRLFDYSTRVDLDDLILRAAKSSQPTYAPTTRSIVGSILNARTQTDSQGAFRLDPFGDNRVAIVKVQGKNIAIQYFAVASTKRKKIQNLQLPYGSSLTGGPLTINGTEPVFIVEPSRPIVGQVVDKKTKRPIAGLMVNSYTFAGPDPRQRFSGRTDLGTTTDSEGRFRLDGMPSGNGHEIFVATDNTSDVPIPYLSNTIEVPGGSGTDPVEIKIEMNPALWIRGSVHDDESGDPLAGVLVSYNPVNDNEHLLSLDSAQRGNTFQTVETDKKGEFKLAGISGLGLVSAIVHHQSGYPKGQGWTKVPEQYRNQMKFGITTAARIVDIKAETVECELRLSKGKSVLVNAVDSNGNPITGIHATLVPSYSSIDNQTFEGSSFQLQGFVQDLKRTAVFNSTDGNYGAIQTISLKDSPVELRMQPVGTVKAKIVTKEGNPTREAKFSLQLINDNDQVLPFVSPESPVSEDGMLERRLIPGKYALSFNSSDGFSGYKKLELKPGTVFDLGTIDISKKFFVHRMSHPGENVFSQVPFEEAKN